MGLAILLLGIIPFAYKMIRSTWRTRVAEKDYNLGWGVDEQLLLLAIVTELHSNCWVSVSEHGTSEQTTLFVRKLVIE
jgi:hypothetical protein